MLIIFCNSFSSLILDVWSRNDDVIAYEILSRLTVKELMRFKCVSKRWQWLIENDPYFIKLHLTQSKKRPIFLYVIPLSNYWKAQKEDRYRGYDELLLTTDLSDQGRAENTVQIYTIRKTDMFCCDHFLASLNGLICFIDRYEHAVCIYNVSTRQVTPWIKSTLLIEEQEKHPGLDVYVIRECSFGFDPSTMEHKVICISSISVEEYHDDSDGVGDDDYEVWEVCEVLTVGENTWRRIDHVPPSYGYQACACVNGSIYWMTRHLTFGDWRKDKDLEHIVAFEIRSEKFRTISLPNCIVDKPLNPNRYCHLDQLFALEVDGRVAFLLRLNPQFVQIRIFNEESSLCNKEIGNKITISTGEKIGLKKPLNYLSTGIDLANMLSFTVLLEQIV
ncbi:putative F-box protein At1g50870 [Papaver somniferum]|uniref:putative F-box protein At1g50870 n=1 Tax=Papaver somniferum TaxID=3469 RepID=UPI000E6F94EC|nr:putative F-box protein At1g50870 [Papaver somniferum]